MKKKIKNDISNIKRVALSLNGNLPKKKLYNILHRTAVLIWKKRRIITYDSENKYENV